MNSLDWLRFLIKFDTTSKYSNLPLIEAIEKWLASHHIVSHITYDSTGKKANLFATLSTFPEITTGGLLLSGHTDVVPVDGQDWKTDPFCLTRTEDKLYGRGTCDMKGFIAIVLALVPTIQKMTLLKPIHLAFSYDEEVGCLGVSSLIDDFKKRGIQPAVCIVGEPTEGNFVVAHKGIHVYRCRVHGRAAHSSLVPQGCNAIEYAADLMHWIRSLSNQLKEEALLDPLFDVPFTSMSINTMRGGTANNIIPSMAEFYFDLRHLPGMDPKNIIDKIKNYISNHLLQAMRMEYADAKIEIDRMGCVPAFQADEKANIMQLVQHKKARKVSYATEAGFFQKEGIQTIVCGPGSIEQAHRENEFISVEQIVHYENFLHEFIMNYSTPHN